jgi:hypothetical protein
MYSTVTETERVCTVQSLRLREYVQYSHWVNGPAVLYESQGKMKPIFEITLKCNRRLKHNMLQNTLSHSYTATVHFITRLHSYSTI